MIPERVKGRFGGTSKRPYIEAHVTIPGLGIAGNVSFLVDTGADSTCLAGSEAIRLGVDYSALPKAAVCTGIGGDMTTYPVEALISFAGTKNLFVFVIELDILDHGSARDIPSLLGRDVLDRILFICDRPNEKLVFEFRTADAVIPLSE